MKSIAENDVTNCSILRLLRNVYLDASLDIDNEIYVRDGLQFPTWVSVLPKERLIKFFTYMDFKGCDFTGCSVFEVASHLNTNIAVPVFYAMGERIYANYFLTYTGGVSKLQLISMLRRFSGAFEAGIRLADIVPPASPEVEARQRLHS